MNIKLRESWAFIGVVGETDGIDEKNSRFTSTGSKVSKEFEFDTMSSIRGCFDRKWTGIEDFKITQ